MNLEEARAYARRHEDAYNIDFEHYHDLYTDDATVYRPVQGATHDRAMMYALEQRATAACPGRKTKVVRVFAGEGEWFGMEELWEGTNTGGDERFGPAGAKVAVYAFSMYEVRDGKFARAIAWTGRPQAPQGGNPMNETTPIVRTRLGAIRGFERHGLFHFRGIPYAKPPIGALRWRIAEQAEPWDGVRDATEYGPSSLQAPIASDVPLPAGPVRPMSEDCLYLNIVTPALDGARPVMVWIHGGGFTTGSGADFSGRQLAERGVVVVTINYRLGALGNLALPSLADDAGRFTNFALRDQIAALGWVRDNIAAFGGDPGNVTIFGESAGGMSIGCLLGSPEARGLFHKAIPQSGACHTALSVDIARAYSEMFCELLGARPDDSEALRNASPEAVLEASNRMEVEISTAAVRARRAFAAVHSPVIDGQCLPEPPIEGVRKGLGSPVPVLAGWTADEFKLFEPAWEGGPPSAAEVEGYFAGTGTGPGAYRFYLDARAARGDSTKPGDIWSAALTDWMFRVPADRLLEANTAAGQPAYGYVFTWESPAAGGALGACHGLDVFFVSGTYALMPAFAGSGPGADGLARTMMDAWVAFARTGDPSTPALKWPRFDAARRNLMLLGERCHIAEGWHEEERRLWDGVVP